MPTPKGRGQKATPIPVVTTPLIPSSDLSKPDGSGDKKKNSPVTVKVKALPNLPTPLSPRATHGNKGKFFPKACRADMAPSPLPCAKAAKAAPGAKKPAPKVKGKHPLVKPDKKPESEDITTDEEAVKKPLVNPDLDILVKGSGQYLHESNHPCLHVLT